MAGAVASQPVAGSPSPSGAGSGTSPFPGTGSGAGSNHAEAVGGDGRPVIGQITASNLVAFGRRLSETVVNWPSVLARLSLASIGVRGGGDIRTELRGGAVIVAPPSRPAWWPTFEMFAEDVYRLSSLGSLALVDGDVILDLGAHIGTAAVLFARRWPDARLVCVEPNPGTFAYLKENLSRNGVNAVALNEAVGAADGRTTLFGIDDASCEASTSVAMSGGSAEVPVAGIARLFADAGGRVRLVKLDCEGAEHEVLAASSSELWSDVEVLLLEYHRTPDPASEWPAVEARVNELGLATLWHMPFTWSPGLGMAAFHRRPHAITGA